MRSGLAAPGPTVLAVAGLVLAGCTGLGATPQTATAPPLPQISSATVAESGPLPAPEALAEVMNRLADPAVPGIDKLPMVQKSAPSDAAILDQFSAALRDGGFSPAVFKVTDVRWADQPGGVIATVTVSTTNPVNTGEFSFPMEFLAGPGGWQLTRDTAEMLLAFGNARVPGR